MTSKKSLAPRKSAENNEKPKKKEVGVKKSQFANRLKRALPKFRGDRSEVRGVNVRSKFAVAAVRKIYGCGSSTETTRYRNLDTPLRSSRAHQFSTRSQSPMHNHQLFRPRRRFHKCFTLHASRRGGDRESFRENSSTNLILQIFWTRRTLGDLENYQLSKLQV